MADAGGFKAKLGVKLGLADWNAAYSAPTALVPFNSESMSVSFDRMEDNSLLGTASRPVSEQGLLHVTGETVHTLDYNNFDALLEGVMGNNAARVFTVSDDDLPKYLCLEVEKFLNRHRFYPAKLDKMVVAGKAGEFVMVTYVWAVRKRDVSGTAFPAIALTGAQNRVRFADLAFRLGDQVDALTGGDAIPISGFELEFSRNLKVDDYATGATPKEVLEPVPGDWRACNLKLTIPRFNSGVTNLVTWKDSDTPLQATLTFTRGVELFAIELPNLRIVDGFDVPISGPGPVTMEGTLQASPSTGGPMYTGNELRITLA